MENEMEKKVLGWLDRVIGKSAKELGLLASESVRKWRFNNQLRILQSAQEKCRKRNISIKVISPKLLCPLLDLSSLEDDDFLQDKWSNLLVNMLDSNQNIQNHVFPFILSQISKNELTALYAHYSEVTAELTKVANRLEDVKTEMLRIRSIAGKKNEELSIKHENHYYSFDEDEDDNWHSFVALYDEESDLLIKKEELENKTISKQILKKYEFANLLRLGLVINIPFGYNSNTPKFEMSYDPVRYYNFSYSITELGELFLKACYED